MGCGYGGLFGVGRPGVTRSVVDGEVILEGTGTVRHTAIEGGWWLIHGDDGKRYETETPDGRLDGGIPAEFRRDGLPVRFKGRVLEGYGSYCMCGDEIIRILSVMKL